MANLNWDHWLSLFKGVAETNCINGCPIVLNRRQNNYLARTCVSKLEVMRTMSIPFECNELEKELEEIEAYLKSCSKKLWWEYFVTKLDTNEGYAIFLQDFLRYSATLDAIVQHSRGCSFVQAVRKSIVESNEVLARPDLSDDVRHDRDAIVELLRSMKKEKRRVTCIGSFFLKPVKHEHRIASFLSKRLSAHVWLQGVTEQALPKQFWIDPRNITRYHKPFAQGNAGSVFEARWLGERVAVKCFKTQDPSFIKEVSMLAALSNPYVIQMIGWSKDNNENYSLVMELMQEDLASYMDASTSSTETPMWTKFAIDIMLQISRGMEYLHEMEVIHRDLKLQNVLVKDCKFKAGCIRIKLSDFGVANFKPNMDSYSTSRQGTTYHRAPEVYRIADLSEDGDIVVPSKYTRKADVFSFAILCYEIIAQESPPCFFNVSPGEVYRRITANVRPRLPDSCPPVLSDCIKQCWDTDPNRRPSFAKISEVLNYVKSALIVIRSVPAAKRSVIYRELLKKTLPEEIPQIDVREGRKED